MKIFFRFAVAVISFCLVSCNEAEIGRSKDVSPDAVYFDYLVTAEEGSDEVTCKLQYKFGGKNGTTLLLDEPSKVTLDGKAIAPDSAKYSGIYYETLVPVKEFAGKHKIEFTAADNKKYVEEFEFRPFALYAELPQKISRQPFVVKLKGLPATGTALHVVMVDTAFASNDVNEEVRAVNGEFAITKAMLAQLSNGPINLEIYKEENKRLKQRTKEGGRLYITYGLKREFELTD